MRPLWKWIIGIFGVLLLIILGGVWYLSSRWKPLLDQQLKQAILQSTDSLYSIDYEDLDLQLLTGKVDLKGFKMRADTNVYAQQKLTFKAGRTLYDVEVDRLRIEGIQIMDFVRKRKLRVGNILIENPKVRMMTDTSVPKKQKSPTDTLSLYQKLESTFSSLSIEAVRLNKVNLSLETNQDGQWTTTVFENVEAKLEDFLVDEHSLLDTSRFLYSKNMVLEIPTFRYETPDSFYYVSFERVRLETGAKRLEIDDLVYEPKMDKATFYKLKKAAKDRIQLSFKKIRLEHFNYALLESDGYIRASHALIDSGTLDVSNDLRYPRIPTNKIGKSPHQQLMKMKQLMHLDSVVIRGVDISYAEISPRYQKEGKITFTKSGGTLYHVTNDSSLLATQPLMTAKMHTRLMNTGRLTVDFGFDMLDKNGAYTYKGQLGAMDGKPLNRILTPLLNAEVASANIKGLRFDMKGTDRRNWGTLHFDYNNMKINLLGKDDEGKASAKKVISFIANSFIINDSNPDANEKYHVGRIQYQRPPTYSFFKTLWKSLLEGIKQTAGISKEREQRLMNTAEQVKEANQQRKSLINRIFKPREKEND
jgi:hypothetical protein